MTGVARDIDYLESRFQTGDLPTQQDFADLFASYLHYLNIVSTQGTSTSKVMSQKAVSDALSALTQSISNLIDSAPNTLDTLNKIAQAIGYDPAFVTTVNNNLAQAIANLIDSAPTALNTLNKIAQAIGYDSAFVTTLTNALALKAPLNNPVLTGSPKAPTQPAGDNSTNIATTAYADAVVTNARVIAALGYTPESALAPGTISQYYRGDKTWQTLDTSVVPENGNLYHTDARVRSAVLTGFVSGAGVLSATDTMLQAIQKLDGNIALQMPLAGGTFTGAVTLSANAVSALQPVTLQQMQAAITGLWNDRGNYTPSGGNYPSTGGSYTGGVPEKGDVWTVSGLGTGNTALVGTKVVNDGDFIRALIRTPGNTDANWAVTEANLGYTPITNVLNSAKILVGSAANVATAVSLSGDAAITNAGVLTIQNSAITYGKIQNMTNNTLLGNTSGVAAAPSEITVENGLTLAASKIKWGGTLTGATTLTNNTENGMNYTGGAFTATANNSYHTTWSNTITLRSTNSDNVYSYKFAPSFVIKGLTQQTTGVDIKTSHTIIGPISSTGGNVPSSSLSGVTAGTYTNVSQTSTTGAGTGALFTVVITTGSSIVSVTPTNGGNGYKPGEILTIVAASLGGGTGSFNYQVGSITTQSLNVNSTVLSLGSDWLGVNNTYYKYLDFKDVNGTSFGAISQYMSGSSRFLAINHASGIWGTISTTSTNITSNVSVTGSLQATTITSNGAFIAGSTISATGSFAVGSGATSSKISNSGTETFFGPNSYYSRFLATGTGVTVGLINALGTITGGTGYTDGNYNNVALTGGTGTGATANIAIVGGVVSAVTKTASGTGYSQSDVLSASTATIGAGTGFSIPVNSVDFTGNFDIGFQHFNTIVDSKSPNNYVSYLSNPNVNLTGNTQQGFVAAMYHNPTLTGVNNAYGLLLANVSKGSGIGTLTPTAMLHVQSAGSATIPTLKLVGTGTTTNLTLAAYQSNGTTSILSLADNGDMSVGLSTSKLGFYGVSAILRPTTAIAAATFAQNTSAIANDTATWGGYTIGQIVTALKNLGLLT